MGKSARPAAVGRIRAIAASAHPMDVHTLTRRRLTERHPWLHPVAVRVHQARRHASWVTSGTTLGDPRIGYPGAAGPRQEARLAAAPRPLPRRDGAPAQQGGQPAAGQRTDRWRRDPAGRDVLVQQGGRQLHPPQGLRRRHAALQRRREGRRRRRHLSAGQPAALDVPALAAHRGRAVRAQLRPVPRQEPGAALGRRLLDRLELRRSRRPERHRRHFPAPHLGRREAPARRAPRGPADRALLQGRGAQGGVRAGRTSGSGGATRSGAP